MQTYILKPHLTRKITVMSKDDPRVPAELFTAKCIAPDLNDFPYPLPSKKSDYTCQATGNGGIRWFGGKTGVTRYDANAERDDDIIMYFSAYRHLPDDDVKAILADGDNLWAWCGDEVSHIEMISMTCEEKDNLLREETEAYVQRRGMVCHMHLKEPRKLETALGETACDNDGLFTACHAVGEMFRYATLKKEKGANHPETIKAKQSATLASEACLLLMYIHGRDEGFISRSYHVRGENVPDDGVFYDRANGDTAFAIESTFTKERNRVGELSPCTYPIPDRLAKLYRDLGYTDNDIIYKADTSSDEVSGHFMQMRFAHDFLAPEDPELDAIIKDACTRTMKHIIDGGYELLESSGKPTTWARWSKDYFENTEFGYCDSPLNSAQLLGFLKTTMYITGEKGIWQKAYDELIADGYAELAPKHYDRFFQSATAGKLAPEEDLMYGDHMLALIAFWNLTSFETDEKLLKLYRDGFKSWKGTYLREHNPGYDFIYKLACPDEEIDIERDASWLYRLEPTRLAATVNVRRHDVPMRISRHGKGDSYTAELSTLLPSDERRVGKYDHNPFQNINSDPSTTMLVEGSYVFTFAYWIGRYYGFLKEED